jgi:acyl carrier protein
MTPSQSGEEAVYRRLAQVFSAVFDEPISLRPDTTAEDIDGWDSVRNVELMVAIEREFAIRFRTGELASLENVGQLVQAVLARAGDSAGKA